MKVAVVGPGALGCLFASRLYESGVKVTLIDRDSARARRLSKQGIVVRSGDRTETANVPVSVQMPNALDYILVVTKAYDTASLRLPNDVAVLTLQNGLGNVETLCGLVGSARVLAGSTTEAVTLVDEGHALHVSPGKTWIGSWTSCAPDAALQSLADAKFDVEYTDAPGQMMWEKASISAGINPLTAILGVMNGQLLEIAETRQLLRDLVVEAAKVAATEGYRFNKSLVETSEEVCQQTAANISSMLQDIRANKRTEIDAISGEILRRSQAASLPCPRTRVVYQLVKGLERR